MKISALERILETDRIRQQTAVKTMAGKARPVLYETEVGPDDLPLLSSNLRGSFLLTPRSRDGTARFAFTECPLGSEDQLLNELYEVLWRMSVQYEWANRCTSIGAAKARMESLGLRPKAFILGPSFLEEAAGNITEDDADKLMMMQGHIAEVEGVMALAANLLPGRAILATTPSQVGDYVRVGDYVGILIHQADRSLVLVGDE